MKLGIISDIHIDVNADYPVLKALARKATEERLFALAIAGDISDDCTLTQESIDNLSQMAGVPVYFVPGNHDMRDIRSKPVDANEVYARYREHPCCLIDKSIPLLGKWVLLGNTGWYDYSFGNKRFSKEEYENKTMYGRTWQDIVYLDWKKTDREVHSDMLDRLEQQLQLTAGKKRIVLTHMVGKRALTVPDSRERWDFFNGFLGSGEYGALFERYGVCVSVMGHVHFRKAFKDNGVSYICSCLNYHSEWQSKDFEKEISDALTILDLSEA